MKLLVKFPTRARKDKFFHTLDLYYSLLSDIENTKFVITLDSDDVIMNSIECRERLNGFPNLSYYYGESKTKIEAVNADMESQKDWDILLLASDDMIPVVKGYDDTIRSDMMKHFPDTNGVLWYNDGYVSHLNTLSIMGRKYYDKFGYIYHPSYKSFWCDNEYQDVFYILNCYCKFDRVIIKHEHPTWTGRGNDQLYRENSIYYNSDQRNYEERKKRNFDL